MSKITKSFLETGNLTRGEFGDIPRPVKVIWDPEINGYRKATADDRADWQEWGCWDSDFGWIAPVPEDDVVDNTEGW